MVNPNKVIRDELALMEEKTDSKLLFAVESGSRCWGFPSRDSDYDVRFVYACKPKSYMSLTRSHDTCEWVLTDELDIVGWDIAKIMRLLSKSNPSAIEWLRSPVRYAWSDVADELHSLSEKCFDPKTEAAAYAGMAYAHDARYIRAKKATAKRYLYAVRAVLAARWCIKRKKPAPMLFEDLKNEMLEPEIMPTVDGLVVDKMVGIEKQHMDNDHLLDAWLLKNEHMLNESISRMKKKKPIDPKELDKLFLDMLEMAWN